MRVSFLIVGPWTGREKNMLYNIYTRYNIICSPSVEISSVPMTEPCSSLTTSKLSKEERNTSEYTEDQY